MNRRWERRLAAAAVLTAAAAPGCGDSPTEMTVVASVALTSAVDTILADGRTSQVTAVARDADGDSVAAPTFNWSSSNPAVISVTARGAVTAEGAGTARITAGVEGSDVAGSINLRVVNADLTAVGTLAGDPYGAVLVNGLSAAARPGAESARSRVAAGAGDGNVVAILSGVSDLRDQAAAATDGDRVLLTVLVLYADQIERRLGL
jgi:hypothetical protein